VIEANGNAKKISVIVPLLNEYKNLPKLHSQLGHFLCTQIIYVDGGSDDGSWQWLQENIIDGKVDEKHVAIQSLPGRALQMNQGAKLAEYSSLLFLHADSVLPEGFSSEIIRGLNQNMWGRFDIMFLEAGFRMKVIAWFMNHRSKLTSIATGDQAIFVRREAFNKIGGFPDIPLMEDVEFSKRLKQLKQNKQLNKPYCSELKVKTSARRWLQNGVFKTVFLMWYFRLLYFFGVSAEKLAQQYKNVR
jgi:rSAM/selenodomain-associated transferase 2